MGEELIINSRNLRLRPEVAAILLETIEYDKLTKV